MVRIHQAARAGHDAVPVGVGVVGKGDVEFLAHPDQPRHCVRRGAVHPDFSVPIHGHEAEGRIDRIADDRRRKTIALDDRLPVMDPGAAQRIDAYSDARGADRLHVDDTSEVGDIGPDVIMAMNARRFARAVIGDAFYAAQTVLEKAVGGALDHRSDIGIRRAAIGRIIFEAAILGGIMRRRDHHAVGKTAVAALVMGQDGVRDHRRRRVTIALVDHRLDAIGGKYFQRARQSRLRQRVGVDADEQRSGNAAALAMIANHLADRHNMRLVEGVVEGGAAMARGAERHPLRRHGRVGLSGKIGRHQPRNVRQHRRLGALAGERIDFGSHQVPFRDSIGSAVNNISGLTVIASQRVARMRAR